MNRSFFKQYYTFLKCLCYALGILFLFSFVLSFSVNTTDKQINIDYKRVIVQEGDTLWSLVQKTNNQTNVHFTVEETIKFNNLTNTYLQPGQVIYIPLNL